MTSLFGYPIPNKNAFVFLVAGVQFISVPNAIKLKDKKDCKVNNLF
jgi:hypothetical protein